VGEVRVEPKTAATAPTTGIYTDIGGLRRK
jgi:hypothetical protein